MGDSHEVGKSYGSNSKSFAHTHGVPGVAHTHSTGNHTLTVAEMPSHTHNIWYFESNPVLSANNQGGGRVFDPSNTWTDSTGRIQKTGGGNAHNHGNTGSTTPSATTTNSQSVSTLDVTPACEAAYCWKRTA